MIVSSILISSFNDNLYYEDIKIIQNNIIHTKYFTQLGIQLSFSKIVLQTIQ